MVNKLMEAFYRFQFVVVVACALAVVGTLAAPARAGTTVTVTSYPVQGSPYEVQENQDSTLTYKLTYSIGKDAEGNTPSLNSITLTFGVNNGGTKQESGSATWTETLAPPKYTLSSPMNVSCEASGPANGNYSVTCEATLNLSDGTTASGGPASDAFLVSQMTVNISGPQYVIIGNGYSSPGVPEPPPDSTYTASVAGEPDPFTVSYVWQLTDNIDNDPISGTGGNTATDAVYGVGPEGPGVITCNVTDDSQNQSGSKQVTVQDQYVVLPNPGYTTEDGPFAAASNAVTATYNGQPITFTVTGTLSQTTGLSTSGGIDLTILENFLSVSASRTQTIENTTAVGSATATGPPADAVFAGTSYWLEIAPIYNVYTGTMQTWDPSGLRSTGKWTNQELGSPAYDEQIGHSTTPPP